MSKKSVKLFCYDCDLEFSVRFDQDEDKVEVEYCPFCGSGIEEEDDEQDVDNEDDQDDDRWN